MPEQEIIDGIVKLKIIEGKIGEITVKGNKHISDQDILERFSVGEIYLLVCLIYGISSKIFKDILKNFLTVTVFMLFFIKVELQAGCRGEGFMGISSRDPIMSWVDLTYSPIYSSASTSGTSGCST